MTAAPTASEPIAPSRAPTVKEVRTAYYEEMAPGERATLLSWLSFTITFIAVRALTYSIRAGKGPGHNIILGGHHLHHYMLGIAGLTGVGAVAVRGDDKTRRHPALALTYGASLALIVDEFALLLDLQDVYWAKQGRVSVDIAIGIISTGGTAFTAVPILRRLARNRRNRDARLAGTAATA